MGIFLKDMNLKGKTALITGATKGIGRGAAIAIAEAGGNIIAIGRNQLELNTLKKAFTIGVSTNVGQTVFTLILNFASSKAIPLARPSIPNLFIL